MTLTEAAAAAAALLAVGALATTSLMDTLDGAMEVVRTVAWDKSVSCVTDTATMSGQTTEHIINGYLDGTVDPNIKQAIDTCIAPLVEPLNGDPFANVPPDVADMLGITQPGGQP